MFAIVNIAGQQMKVAKDQEIFVHQLEAEKDQDVTFDEVLLISGDDSTDFGTPMIKGATVGATVLDHVKGDKVMVFKKKRRKGYKVKKGHRQHFTKLRINSINA